jgi:hypothetical protein
MLRHNVLYATRWRPVLTGCRTYKGKYSPLNLVRLFESCTSFMFLIYYNVFLRFFLYCSLLGARDSVVVRHYATNRKVVGSIPDEVIFLNLLNPSGRLTSWGLLSP